MRKIEITNEKILKLLNSKKEISDKQLVLLKQQEELEAEFNKNTTIHQRIDEKSRPLIRKVAEAIEMGEYEQLSKVSQGEDLKWYIEIADRLEEFKARFKKEQDANK